MADGITFERLGVPAVSIITDAFTGSSDAMARLQGAPGYRYAMVPHPLSSLTPEECKQRAGEVLPDVIDILGLGVTAGADSGTGETETTLADSGRTSSISTDDLTADRIRELGRVIEYCYEQEWTDGLPVVPVTTETVREFVEHAGRDPGETVVEMAHLERTCTVELAAVAAAMAGCRAEHFPMVLAAAEAMQPAVTTGLVQSTTGQATLVVVNGPSRQKLGFNAAGNVFGSGFRANATVGRALRLIVMNAFGVRPGSFDQSTQGTPGKYSLCIAENEEENPWEPLHVERGFAAEVDAATVELARSTLHVENRSSNRPEEVLLTIADSMSYAGSYMAGRACTVVMGPEHAQLIARQGWSKPQIKQFLWENWGRRKGDLRRCGLLQEGEQHPDPLSGAAAEGAADDGFLRFGESPDSILLVVAGAKNAGVSTVLPAVRSLATSKQIG